MDNRTQPDACLIIDPACGGNVKIVDRYIVGSPELVAEVAATSESFDLGDKFDVYRQFGVKEYLVWRVFDEQIDWFILRGGQYERLQPSPDGIYRAETFPGLWLDPAALIRGDMATVARDAQQGIADPTHAEFIARLQQGAARVQS
jgi:Uma2 family endonuclease